MRSWHSQQLSRSTLEHDGQARKSGWGLSVCLRAFAFVRRPDITFAVPRIHHSSIYFRVPTNTSTPLNNRNGSLHFVSHYRRTRCCYRHLADDCRLPTADIIEDTTNAAEDAANVIADAAEDAAKAAGSWVDNAASNVEELYHDAASAAEDAYDAAASAAKETCNKYNADHSTSLDCNESTASAAADAAANAAEEACVSYNNATDSSLDCAQAAASAAEEACYNYNNATQSSYDCFTINAPSTTNSTTTNSTTDSTTTTAPSTVTTAPSTSTSASADGVSTTSSAPTHGTPGFASAYAAAITLVALLANLV